LLETLNLLVLHLCRDKVFRHLQVKMVPIMAALGEKRKVLGRHCPPNCICETLIEHN